MTDREKVIKGFTCCEIDASCANCPYFDSNTCIADLRKDVFDLLKEQSKQKHGHWIEYPKCLEYDGALDDTYIVCSACEHVFNVIDNCTELFDYCPKCGAKMDEGVKQDDHA